MLLFHSMPQNNLSKDFSLSALQTKPDACANSVDPDETASEPSHQDLHCLPFCFDFWLTFLFATIDVSKFNDGNAHFIKSGWKGSV